MGEEGKGKGRGVCACGEVGGWDTQMEFLRALVIH